MIDNTSSASDAGSLSPQAKANSVHQTKVANISDTVKTEVVEADKVIAQTAKISDVDKKAIDERTEIEPKELEQVVKSLNAFVQLMKRDVLFAVDENSGRDVISVFEAETQELIRQIPSEEALELLKRMDVAVGLLFSERV